MKNSTKTDWRKLFLTILRIAVGWHFLYEGVSKLFISSWSSYTYLANSTGPISGFYHWIAASPHLLKVIDILNMYGLILIGLALFIGILSRVASFFGALLLILYYFAYPPFGASIFNIGEGHLFIVDKLFLEAAVLLFMTFFREKGYGIDSMAEYIRNKNNDPVGADYSDSRREVLKNLSTIPILGAVGWMAAMNNRKYSFDVMSGETIQVKKAALGELKGKLPMGKIGKHEISRMVLGGNLIGGWAHSRDLIYVPELFKAYNTEKKIYETLILAEKAGINCINIGFPTNELIARYKKTTGSKLKVISQVHPDMQKNDYFVNIDKAIDFGVDIVQIQGNWCDWLVRDKKIDVVAKMMDRIRSQNYTAGLAAHTVDALIVCESEGIIPDYYMKTLHHDKYWSAHPKEFRVAFEVDGEEYLDHNKFHNNMFDLYPERSVEFVEKAKVPVMGYKILAAGAIEPKDGFRYAFENGADFICVGMFDFQIVKDVNICLDILGDMPNRKREWFG
jgi:uncharacterized membrane protein YphA (DoxX/SURF4 family)